MSDGAQDEPGDFLGDILQRIGDIMGEKAGRAAIRFAAQSEGRRIGSGHGPDDLRQLLERLDAVLGHRTTGSDASDPIRITVEPGRLAGRPLGRALLAGALEGALGAWSGKRLEADVEAVDGSWAVELRPVQEGGHG